MKIDSVVFCDEVRRELSGKDIIIGAYSGDIVLPAFPGWFSAAFWIEVLSDEKDVGEREYEMRLTLVGISTEPTSMKIKASIQRAGSSAIVLTGMQMRAEKQTEVILEIQLDGEWKVIKRKKVVSSMLQPPSPLPTFGSRPPSDS